MNLRPNVNGPLAWSLIAIAVVVVSIAMMLPAVLTAAFTPGPEDGVLDEAFVRLMSESDEALATYESRFVGRSAFYIPRVVRTPVRMPAPPPVRTEKVDSAPPPPPPPPPPPRRYEGPDIMAFVGDEVWFTDDTRVRAGQVGDNGVTVLSVQAPWKAILTYRGWEGDVTLFESNLVGLIAGAPPRRGGLPGIVDETPVPAPAETPAEAPVETPDEDGAAVDVTDTDSGTDSANEADTPEAETPETEAPEATDLGADGSDDDGTEGAEDTAVETGTAPDEKDAESVDGEPGANDAPKPSEPAPAIDTPKTSEPAGESVDDPEPSTDKPKGGADSSPPD